MKVGKRVIECLIRNVVELAIDLFCDPRTNESNSSTVYDPKEMNGERVYSELNTGDLWWEAEKSVPAGGTTLAIMGYTDSTNVTRNGSISCYPFVIYLACHDEVGEKSFACAISFFLLNILLLENSTTIMGEKNRGLHPHNIKRAPR